MSFIQGQDFQLDLVSNVDLSTAAELKIRYEKPKGARGELDAVAGGDGNTTAEAQMTAAINDEAGIWNFQIYTEISSKIYYSTKVEALCKTNISL